MDNQTLEKYLDAFPWIPQVGPQSDAYFSEADLLLYGGAAGGGKTALACGLSCTTARETLFLRREATQLTAVIDEFESIFGSKDGYNGQDKLFRLPEWDGVKRKVLFGSTPNPGDETKYQGRPRDNLVIDEAANMLESAVSFLMGWVRSTVPGQRCRTLLCSNPPTSAEGEWLIRWFAPWLDPAHELYPYPPGELLWYARIKGEDTMVEGPDPIEVDGELVRPLSRTFIPARITDNKYLRDTGYMAVLQGLPEPLRSQMLKGDWLAGRQDSDYQVVPSSWIQQAQARWRPKELNPHTITSCGVDPSRGGHDDTTISYREGWYFHALQVYPGHTMKSGNDVAAKVIEDVGTSHCPINVDVIGIGASVVDSLDMHIPGRVVSCNAAGKSTANDWSGSLSFANKRAEWWWRMRDLLNPENAQQVALPPDQTLFAELCAPTYELTPSGIKVESKEQIRKRLGRSTDRADAVIMCAERSSGMQIVGLQRPQVVVKGAISR